MASLFKLGNPAHWFGRYYFGSDVGGTFILYDPADHLSKVIQLKSKKYKEALKEANEFNDHYQRNIDISKRQTG